MNTRNDQDSDLSDDEPDTACPSILKIMASNQSSILQTISLIHKEAARFNVEVEPNVERSIRSLADDQNDHDQPDNRKAHIKAESTIEDSKDAPSSSISTDLSASSSSTTTFIESNKLLVQSKEIEGLSSFMADTNVQQLIKSVAGDETTTFIDKTLNELNSKDSIQGKREVLSGGIKQLYSDLLINKDQIARDPLFSLALGVAGINKRSINFE